MNEENMKFLDSITKRQLEAIFKYQQEITEKYKKLIEQEKLLEQKKKLAKLHGKGGIKNEKNIL